MNAKVRLQRVMGQRKPSPSPFRYPQIQSPSIDNSNMIILMYQENQQQNQVTQVYLTALIILWYIIITIMMYQKKRNPPKSLQKHKLSIQTHMEFKGKRG